MPSAEIRLLREQVTDVLFTAHGPALSRLAAASRLLPVALVATLGEKVFGPVLSARVAGLLDPGRAVEMASRLPIEFLADVAIELDPRRASEVIGRIPPEQIAAITRELIGRGEYVTMGRFVGHLSSDAIVSAVGVMDDTALLRVAFVLESKDSLEDLVGVLPSERLDGIIEAAANADLWPEVLDLLGHLALDQRRELVERASAWDAGAPSARCSTRHAPRTCGRSCSRSSRCSRTRAANASPASSARSSSTMTRCRRSRPPSRVRPLGAGADHRGLAPGRRPRTGWRSGSPIRWPRWILSSAR